MVSIHIVIISVTSHFAVRIDISLTLCEIRALDVFKCVTQDMPNRFIHLILSLATNYNDNAWSGLELTAVKSTFQLRWAV